MSNVNGDVWGVNAREFFKANWFLIVALVAVLGWGLRLEANTQDRFTSTDAGKQKAEILLIIEENQSEIKDSISGVAVDVAYIRGRYEADDASNKD
jgi:hypothetical protein